MKTIPYLKAILVGTGLTAIAALPIGCDEKEAADVLNAARRLQAPQFCEGHEEGSSFHLPVLQGTAVGNPGTIN